MHTLEFDEQPDYKTGYSLLSNEGAATPHNNQTNKIAPVLQTLPHDTSSAQMSFGIPNTQLSGENTDSADHTSENNISMGDSSVRLSAHTTSRNARKFSLPELYCTCKVSTISHFATYPPALIEPCILAGSRPGDTVLDPFGGSGTTGAVAIKHHRNAILCELNPAYIELIRERMSQVQPVLMVQP
jgi:hypothetical protein